MMKKLLICFLLFSICSVGLHAQKLHQAILRGKIENIPPTAAMQAAFEFWNIDRWQPLEQAIVKPGGSFYLELVEPPPGQCRIRMWNQSTVWSDFIIPDTAIGDAELVFDLDFNTMHGGPANITGSEENEMYFFLMSSYQHLQMMRDSQPNVDALEQKFNKICKQYSTTKKGSFVGDIVANLLYQPSKADYPNNKNVAGMTANAFVKAHALDAVPFRYERALHHNAFLKDLNRFYNYFDRTPDGSREYIDAIMSRRNGSDEVDGFLFKYLLEKMVELKDEPGLTYLLTWYSPDCSDENPMPDGISNLLESLKNCEPGKVVQDLKLPDVNGNLVSLNDVCAKNKITLLLFWRSNCSHCQEFEPVLEKIYEKYHPLGVEVYALSTDKTQLNWKEFLQRNKFPWPNVYIPQDQRTMMQKSFPAPSTPTLIAVDKNRKVLSRLITRTALEPYLDDMLSKL